MARPREVLEIGPFLGLNRTAADEDCALGEYRDGTNLDLSDKETAGDGILTKGYLRPRRPWAVWCNLDPTPVIGLGSWDAPTVADQTVAINNNAFWHSTAPGGTPTTKVSSPSLSAVIAPVVFAPFRSGATPKLFFCGSEGALRSWDGTTLVASISGAPAATFIAVYKDRLFAIDGSATLYWSAVGDGTLWSVGAGGGSAVVGLSDTDKLVGLGVVGSSLLVVKSSSIARFTGTDAETIEIDVGSEGVSRSIGSGNAGQLSVGHGNIITTDWGVLVVDERALYLAGEAGVTHISAKLGQPAGLGPQPRMAAYDPNRRAIWYFVYQKGFFLYRPETGVWVGPWTSKIHQPTPFTPASMCAVSTLQGAVLTLAMAFGSDQDNGTIYVEDYTAGACTDGAALGNFNPANGVSVDPLLQSPRYSMGAPTRVKAFRELQLHAIGVNIISGGNADRWKMNWTSEGSISGFGTVNPLFGVPFVVPPPTAEVYRVRLKARGHYFSFQLVRSEVYSASAAPVSMFFRLERIAIKALYGRQR